MSELAEFLEVNYPGTSEERQTKLQQWKDQREVHRRQQSIDHLFNTWDSGLSGYLELEELLVVIKTWKDFSDEQGLLRGGCVCIICVLSMSKNCFVVGVYVSCVFHIWTGQDGVLFT